MTTLTAAVSVEDVTSFQAARPRLFAVASSVLRDRVEADDVVQDAWTRWQGTDRSGVRDATGFLVTTTRRLALNVADSARVRRETAVGTWLPERIDGGADPARDAEQRDALERAVLVLMERLTPAERAAYVLREAFDYPHRQIAELLAVSEAYARQLVARARGHLSTRAGTPVDPDDRRRFAAAFAVAAQTGEMSALEELLLSDAGDRSGAMAA
jgi:RNA polymerase sigma-70 factor, ECF subfamily